jgi:hypothetical protein
MRLSQLDTVDVHFRTNDAMRDEIRHACATNADLAEFHDLGRSEEGRPFYGVTLGHGPLTVTLKAGAHADEPVGPETLRLFILGTLAQRDWLAEDGGFNDLFERFTFRVVPHVNPDGEARNQPWIGAWPDVEAYLRHRVREQPGRDVEFGYPVMREENRLASRFFFDYSPIALHMSLHGMGFSEGAMLLVERHWVGRTDSLRTAFVEAAREAGLALHDHDRNGEKGFDYVEPGFWTTPEGSAMREHFRDLGDYETARNFHCSSMEMARLTGYDNDRRRHPLALVTELPLFVIGRAYEHEPGLPSAYLALRDELPELKLKLEQGQSIDDDLAPFELRPLDLAAAMRLQLRCIELGLDAVSDGTFARTS